MKTKPNAWIILILGALVLNLVLIHAEDNAAAKKETDLLQGEWVMVSGIADGNAMPAEMVKQSKRVCKGDETTVMIGSQLLMKAKFSVDPSKSPKTIDYDMIGGFTKGKKQFGIYEIQGDTFKACFGSPGAPRPDKFESKSGDGRTLSVWKRETAAPGPNAK